MEIGATLSSSHSPAAVLKKCSLLFTFVHSPVRHEGKRGGLFQEGWGMPHYRIYRRNPDGYLEPPYLIEVDDDAAASKHAREHAEGHGVEIWDGERLVELILADGL
jgi:hypothetical protein